MAYTLIVNIKLKVKYVANPVQPLRFEIRLALKFCLKNWCHFRYASDYPTLLYQESWLKKKKEYYQRRIEKNTPQITPKHYTILQYFIKSSRNSRKRKRSGHKVTGYFHCSVLLCNTSLPFVHL